MSGLTHTLDIARRALMAQQSVISVLGHNVANANTEGYTRQVAHLETVAPSAWGTNTFGNGVTMSEVQRKRDQSLDSELRRDMSSLGRWQMRSRRLSSLEVILNEPSDSGLGATMDAFWASWIDLASDPADVTRRANTREQSEIMANRFNALTRQVEQIGVDIDAEVRTRTDQFNLALSELKETNSLIQKSVLQGLEPNDLLDRRDQILDQMAELVGITYGTRDDGTAFVKAGSVLILDQTTYRPLEAVTRPDETGAESVRIEVKTIGEIDIDNGILGGLLEMRTETIPDFIERVDALASGIIDQVNALHRTGPSQVDFFSGTGAADMSLSSDISESLALLNTSTTGLAGDNDIALAIGGVRNQQIMNNGSSTPNEYWINLVGQVGIVNREAGFQEEGLELTTQALQEHRDSISGVSLDEEMGNIVIAQQSYMAAVKLFEISGNMMDALLAI